MTAIDYVIVGAEVDEARSYLTLDQQISDSPLNGAEPLNVEFIGKLITELSARGPREVTDAELQTRAEQVRQALRVRELTGPGGARLSDEQKQAILDATKVRIVFESRDIDTAPHSNLRILVVPSDRTLAIKMDELAAFPKGPGFIPPLSYELDEALILASLAERIRDIVAGFGLKSEPGWTDELQSALNAHVAEQLEALTTFNDGDGAVSASAKNAIMGDPVRAFHRSVGIYSTNMCR